MTTTTNTQSRRIVKTTRGMPAEDGAGVKLTRMVGQPQLNDLDPILMLDSIRSDAKDDYMAGFPPHPHRGFETVTYMIRGAMEHRDNKGGHGLITDGGVQWMTAARGVVHSEMPAQSDGALFGFQLWLNLPAAEKMSTPWYRDIKASEIPTLTPDDGATVKLIGGIWGDQRGPAPERATEPFIADVALAAYGTTRIPLPEGHAGFAFVFEGGAAFGPKDAATVLRSGDLGVFGEGGGIDVAAQSQGARMLVVAAKPIGEPIAKYGPFVMNTERELRQAIEDFRAGKF